MSMTVDVSVNGHPIRRLLIENLTERSTGANTYRWTCGALNLSIIDTLLSAQQGEIEHVYEDGAMALIAKVAEAAAATEAAAS